MLAIYFDIIRNRNFRLLWWAQITSQIAINMLSFVLAIMVYQQTRSNLAVSLMLLSFAVPSVILGVAAGGIVDFYDKRIILIICNLLRVFTLFAFFLLADNILALFLLTIITSIITQFFIPAEAPSIPSLVPEEELLTANSLFTISFYLSTVLGFILAGPMVKLLGERNVYLFMLALLSLATIFVYFLPPIVAKKREKKEFNARFFTNIIEDGLRFINENVRIKQSLILLTFSQALITTLAVLAPGFSDSILGIDLKDASYLIMGPAAIGLVGGAFWVGAAGSRFLKGTIILWGIVSVAIILMLLSFITKAAHPSFAIYIFSSHSRIVVNNLIIAMILLFLLGVSNSFISVPANAILQGDSSSQMRGRVYGVLTSLTGGVSLVPVVFSGMLADIAGVEKALSILGVAVLTAGIYHYLQRRKVNNTIK